MATIYRRRCTDEENGSFNLILSESNGYLLSLCNNTMPSSSPNTDHNGEQNNRQQTSNKQKKHKTKNNNDNNKRQ